MIHLFSKHILHMLFVDDIYYLNSTQPISFPLQDKGLTQFLLRGIWHAQNAYRVQVGKSKPSWESNHQSQWRKSKFLTTRPNIQLITYYHHILLCYRVDIKLKNQLGPIEMPNENNFLNCRNNLSRECMFRLQSNDWTFVFVLALC